MIKTMVTPDCAPRISQALTPEQKREQPGGAINWGNSSLKQDGFVRGGQISDASKF